MTGFASRSLRRLPRRRTALGVLGALVAVAVVALGAPSVTAADHTPNLGPAVRVGSATGTPSYPPLTSRPATAHPSADEDADHDGDHGGDQADEVNPGTLPAASDDTDDRCENDHDSDDSDDSDDDGVVGHEGD
jgi:hypothetical protein